MLNNYTNHIYDLTIPRPEKGEPYADPHTGYEIVRLTDSLTEFPPVTSVQTPYASPGYPLWNNLNVDGTLIHLRTGTAPYERIWSLETLSQVAHLPPGYFGGGFPVEPRWDKDAPNLIYGVFGNKILAYHIDTGTTELIYDFNPDFPGAASVSWSDKGDFDATGKLILLRVLKTIPGRIPGQKNVCVLLFDLKTRSIVERIEGEQLLQSVGLDSSEYCQISRYGHYCWFSPHHFISRLPGFTNWKDLLTSGHGEPAVTRNGRECMVHIAGRFIGNQNCGSWVYVRDFQTLERTWICPLDNHGFHVSGNFPGWALISCYEPRERENDPAVADPTLLNDALGNHKTFLVELYTGTDRPPVMIPICHNMIAYQTYSNCAFSKISSDGTNILFGSSWRTGRYPPFNTDEYQYDAYMVDLGPGWWNAVDYNAPLINHPYPDHAIPATEPYPAKDPVAVPDVTGMPLADANIVLRQSGFRPWGWRIYDDSPAEEIIEQWPKSGELYDMTYVGVEISRGPGDVVEPPDPEPPPPNPEPPTLEERVADLEMRVTALENGTVKPHIHTIPPGETGEAI